ncbi:MAG: hypothetical protein KAI18_00185 [Candidatus Aenigmarchaeota archaeon]|nr:hypothetical protein [Candidatus Aenigmarchaeota archaeon]
MHTQMSLGKYPEEKDTDVMIYRQYRKQYDDIYGTIHYYVYLARNPDENDHTPNKYNPEDTIIAIIEDKKHINDDESFCYVSKEMGELDIEDTVLKDVYIDIRNKIFSQTNIIQTDEYTLKKWYSDLNDGTYLKDKMKEYRLKNREIPKIVPLNPNIAQERNTSEITKPKNTIPGCTSDLPWKNRESGFPTSK